jgi:creatinine amidohydrolase
VFAGPRFRAVARALRQQPYGSHADEIETSLMLAIAPELVDMTRARPSPVSPCGAPNYSPSGSLGDPTLASIDKGSRLLAAILEDLMEAAKN